MRPAAANRSSATSAPPSSITTCERTSSASPTRNAATAQRRVASKGAEVKLEYAVDDPGGDPIQINARIDRFEIFEQDLGVIVDYKYSTDVNIKKAIDGHGKGRKVQAALYLSGLQQEKGVRPAGMRYWGLRKSTTRQGWLVDGLLPAGVVRDKEKRVSEMDLQRMLEEARALTAAKIREIRGGKIKVDPVDRGFCRNFCDYRDICRVRL